MIEDMELFRHLLPKGPGIYFVLKQVLDSEQFFELCSVLEGKAGKRDTQATVEQHWAALEERMAGQSRWDKLAKPFKGTVNTPEQGLEANTSQYGILGTLTRRPYTSYTIDGITYVLDAFNPKNELEINYPNAGEPVLFLRLHETEWGNVQRRLSSNNSFYEILKEFDSIIKPDKVRGTDNSAWVVNYAKAASRQLVSPWEFLFPVTVLSKSDIKVSPQELQRLKKVDEWSNNRVLLQVSDGLDSLLTKNYPIAAHALGRMAIQELVSGAY